MSKREIVHLTEEERAWCRENFNFVLTMGGNHHTFVAPTKKMRLTPDLLKPARNDARGAKG